MKKSTCEEIHLTFSALKNICYKRTAKSKKRKKTKTKKDKNQEKLLTEPVLKQTKLCSERPVFLSKPDPSEKSKLKSWGSAENTMNLFALTPLEKEGGKNLPTKCIPTKLAYLHKWHSTDTCFEGSPLSRSCFKEPFLKT